MTKKEILNFGFDDEVLKGSKPNEPNIAVKIMKNKNKVNLNKTNISSLDKKEKIIILNIISSIKTEQMLNELEQLNYKINRSQIYREAVKNIYNQIINKNT